MTRTHPSDVVCEENGGFCYLHGDQELGFGPAQAFCNENEMELPLPTNEDANEKFSAFGSSWMNLFVNELLEDEGKFTNFAARQRGYLQDDGTWDVRHGGEISPFFCVQTNVTCENIFTDGTLHYNGQWSRMDGFTRGFTNFNIRKAHDFVPISVGSVFNFRCTRKNMRKWNKRRDSSFKCVRSEGEAILAKCKDRRCGQFRRVEFTNYDKFNCEFN